MNQLAISPSYFERFNPISEKAIEDTLNNNQAEVFFNAEVHQNSLDVFSGGRPRLLSTLSGEGKSTEMNYIKVLFRKKFHAEKDNILHFCFDETWNRKSRTDLYGKVRANLGNVNGITLHDFLENQSHNTLLLMFDNCEFLNKDTITWLLSNIHSIEESYPDFLFEKKIFIVLGGNFSLGNISHEIFSAYYPDNTVANIDDFSYPDLIYISDLLKNKCGYGLTDDAIRYLFNLTSGSKRFVNYLIFIVLKILYQQRGNNLTEDHFITEQGVKIAEQQYRNFDILYDLKIRPVLNKLYADNSSKKWMLKLLKPKEVDWEEVPPATHKMLFDQSIVEVKKGKVLFKNYLIKKIMCDAFLRRKKLFSFFKNYLPRDAILRKEERIKRQKIAKELTLKILLGELHWIYYGEVIGTGPDYVEVHFFDINNYEYTGQLTNRNLGIILSLGEGFLKYSTWSNEGPIQKYYLFDHE